MAYNPDTNRLYVHIFTWPFRHLHLDGFADRVEYAQLLNDASEVRFHKPRAGHTGDSSLATETLTLELPVQNPNVTVPVVELFLKV